VRCAPARVKGVPASRLAALRAHKTAEMPSRLIHPDACTHVLSPGCHPPGQLADGARSGPGHEPGGFRNPPGKKRGLARRLSPAKGVRCDPVG
jgi:hypothetical protein